MGWEQGEPYVEEVADGVFAFVQPHGGWMVNNTGFVVGAQGGSVLVDTSSTHARTERYLAEVRRRAPGDPLALVNTHHHADHTYGNSLVPLATAIVAHERCREELLRAGHEVAQAITDPDYGDLELRPPNITFRDRLTIHVDDEPVELVHVGPAHTTNDVLVWLPRTRTLFAGDVVFNGGQPFLLEGSVLGYSRALACVRELRPEVVVPGHGPVCRGAGVARLLGDLEDYASFVIDTARRGREAGLAPVEAARAVRHNPFGDWPESERLAGNLLRAYSELAGDTPGTRISVLDGWAAMCEYKGGPIDTDA